MTTPDNLTAALASVQANLPHITKGKTATVRTDKGSYSYSYADLGDIAPAIHPLLAQVGLAFVALPTVTDDGRFVLAFSLRHTSGETIEGSYPLPDPTRTTPQQIGSAITYARRYTLCCVTGVVPDEDDDGATANATTPEQRAQRISTTPPDDPWLGPPVTDPKWAAGFRERVLACTSIAVARGLFSELASEVNAGHVADTDATDLKALIEEHAETLKPTEAVSA